MIFHVLNRANARARIFHKEEDYAALERVMLQTLEKKPMRILGYLIMPNHWHMVLWPKRDGELAAFMQRLTVAHVRRWHLHRESVGCGHLYQGTYKSFPVESDEHLLEVLSSRIRTVPGVRSTETFVYLKLRKQTYSWGVR